MCNCVFNHGRSSRLSYVDLLDTTMTFRPHPCTLLDPVWLSPQLQKVQRCPRHELQCELVGKRVSKPLVLPDGAEMWISKDSASATRFGKMTERVLHIQGLKANGAGRVTRTGQGRHCISCPAISIGTSS